MRSCELRSSRSFKPLCWLPLSCVLFIVACGGRGAMRVAQGGDPAFREDVSVRVINDNYYSARIRAVYDGGNRYIIGTVESHRTADDFVIPWQPKMLWFEIDLIVGPGLYLSDRVHVEPGDLVELRLPPDLEQSGFFRRVRRELRSG